MLDKAAGQFSAERIVLSTNGIGAIGFPHAKQRSWTTTLHYIQKLTKNRYRT